MIFPVLAGLGALAACMSNPRRRRSKARRRNPAGASLTPYKQTFGRKKESILSTHSSTVRRKIMRMQFPNSTRQDHARAAKQHQEIMLKYDAAWGRIADKAAKETFGRPWQFTDYKVSGIGRDEFPGRLKKLLRLTNHRASEHRIAAAAHEAMAGVGAMRKAAKSNPRRKGRGSYLAPGTAAARLAKWRWHHNPHTNPRTTVKRYCGQLVISLGVDENKSMPPRANYFGRVSGSGVDYPFNDLSILLPPHSGIDAPVSFDKAAEAILHFASNDVGDEIFGLAEDDPATAERETTFVIQRKKGGTKFYPARPNNPRRKRRRK